MSSYVSTSSTRTGLKQSREVLGAAFTRESVERSTRTGLKQFMNILRCFSPFALSLSK